MENNKKIQKSQELYQQGVDSKAEGDGRRINRLANKIGRLFSAEVRHADLPTEAELRAIKLSKLDSAIGRSFGVNTQALLAARMAAPMLDQSVLMADLSQMVVRIDGKTRLQWSSRFCFSDALEYSEKSFTSLIGQSPVLNVDSRVWSGGELMIPVRDITLISESDLDRGGYMGPVKTLIYINKESNQNEDRLTQDSDMTVSTRLAFNEMGQLKEVGFERGQYSGYFCSDPSDMTIDTSQMMEQVLYAIEQTSGTHY